MIKHHHTFRSCPVLSFPVDYVSGTRMTRKHPRKNIHSQKCLEVLFQCKGNENLARTRLKSLVRLYKTRYPEASSAAREVVAAQAIVHRETTARLRAAAAGGGAGTTRRTGSWEGVSVLASRDCTSSSSSPNRGYAGDGGNGSAFWRRPLKALVGGEAALRRQVEGGVSCSPPGVRRRDDLPSTLNLSRPWSEADAETFTQALLEEGSKNFYAVQVRQQKLACPCIEGVYLPLSVWNDWVLFLKDKKTVVLSFRPFVDEQLMLHLSDEEWEGSVSLLS